RRLFVSPSRTRRPIQPWWLSATACFSATSRSAVILLVFAGSVKVWPLAWTVSVRRRGRTARWTRRSRAACELSPPTSTPPIRTPGAIRSVREWSYAYAAAAAMPARTTRNPSTMKGARLRERRRWVARLLAGGRPSWTVAFTCTGCHTKRPWADNGVAPRTVCTASVLVARTYDHQDRPGTAHHAARRHGDPPARLRRLPGAARGHRRGRDPRVRRGLPSHRHRGRLPERGRGRPGVPRVRPGPRGRLHHDQVLQHRPWPRGGAARVQA